MQIVLYIPTYFKYKEENVKKKRKNNFILCHTGHTPGKHGIGFTIKIL